MSTRKRANKEWFVEGTIAQDVTFFVKAPDAETAAEMVRRGEWDGYEEDGHKADWNVTGSPEPNE